MTTIVYGISNCDTVKKARAWLAERGVSYAFHDYKKAGITADKVGKWCDVAGWEKLLNRAGTTYKKLPDSAKMGLDRSKAIELMCQQPSMIKRPVVEHEGRLLVGFAVKDWDVVFPS